jgi:hypothetical protein
MARIAPATGITIGAMVPPWEAGANSRAQTNSSRFGAPPKKDSTSSRRQPIRMRAARARQASGASSSAAGA